MASLTTPYPLRRIAAAASLSVIPGSVESLYSLMYSHSLPVGCQSFGSPLNSSHVHPQHLWYRRPAPVDTTVPREYTGPRVTSIAHHAHGFASATRLHLDPAFAADRVTTSRPGANVPSHLKANGFQWPDTEKGKKDG
ncbi:MAG: hypothetical protein FWD75_01900 [Propionibacteriaceae bacterium]|nr:hypothetical protein [Propionibacteriaceae bacterium]